MTSYFRSFLALSLLAVFFVSGCAHVHESTEEKSFQKRYQGFRYCAIEAVDQTSQKSCGAAALTSVLNYWKAEDQPPFDEEALQAEYPAESEEGYPILQLRRMALEKGFAAFAVQLDENPWDQMSDHITEGRPIIAAFECPRGRYFGGSIPLVETFDRRAVMSTGKEWKSHYVVIMGRSYDEVLVMDPDYGIVAVNRDQFMRFWEKKDYAALICSSL